MTALTRARLLAVGALTTLCLALAAPIATAAEGAAPQYTKESQQAYEGQLKAGEIASATFNKRLRSLRLTLKNGEHVLYRYPKKGSKPLQEALKAKHVSVTILKPSEAASEAKSSKKPGHKLRYIVGGVLIVVLVLVGGVLAFNRSRAAREE
jgi:hypothetical protein